MRPFQSEVQIPSISGLDSEIVNMVSRDEAELIIIALPHLDEKQITQETRPSRVCLGESPRARRSKSANTKTRSSSFVLFSRNLAHHLVCADPRALSTWHECGACQYISEMRCLISYPSEESGETIPSSLQGPKYACQEALPE